MLRSGAGCGELTRSKALDNVQCMRHVARPPRRPIARGVAFDLKGMLAAHSPDFVHDLSSKALPRPAGMAENLSPLLCGSLPPPPTGVIEFWIRVAGAAPDSSSVLSWRPGVSLSRVKFSAATFFWGTVSVEASRQSRRARFRVLRRFRRSPHRRGYRAGFLVRSRERGARRLTQKLRPI